MFLLKSNTPSRRRKFDYTWVIVALSFLMVFTCLGFCSSNKSLYLSAITEALGIKRSAFSIGDSCRFIATAVVNMFFGTLVYRFGTKKLIAAGFICLIASALLYSVGTHILVFYIAGAMLGVGLSWTTTTMVGCIINKWCTKNRGTIMGAVLAANGLGGALAAQIVSPIIYQEGNPFGYQNAYRLVALILLVVGALIVIFYKENPPGAEPGVVIKKKKGRGRAWVGISFESVKKKPYFYFAALCIFLTGLVLQAINGIAAAHMKDMGLDAGYVATVLSFHSLALAGFKFLTGFLYDRFGLRTTMTICDVTAVLVMLALSMVTNSPIGMLFAMFYGIFSSLALPLETIMLPIFAADLFGEKDFNKIMGIFVSVNTTGYAVGAPLMNFSFDVLGTYVPMLIVCSVLMIVISVVFQFVLTSAQRQRLQIESQVQAQETTLEA